MAAVGGKAASVVHDFQVQGAADVLTVTRQFCAPAWWTTLASASRAMR